MKKTGLILAFFITLLMIITANAEEATDITKDCKISTTGGKFKNTRIYDRQYKTYWISNKDKTTYIQFDVKGSEQIHSVYVCFWDELTDWEIQVKKNGDWVTYGKYPARYAHEYVVLDHGYDGVRVCGTSERKSTLSVSEIYVFSQGEAPSYVQQWEEPAEKADLLVLVAHPDDELLFFGGALPYYAGEMKKVVQVCYLTYCTFMRRSELLDGLWACGVRNYPDIGSYWDKYSKKLDVAYEAWGKTNVWQHVTGLLRKYQPQVVLTQDENGEYGHGAHRVCADAMEKCIEYAADPGEFPESYESYGIWQVKKLYIHLYGENTLEMDWDQPLTAFGGKTGFEVAKEAYTHHVSQQNAGQKNAKGVLEVFVVEPRDSVLSSYRFGLYYSSVGPDEAKNDFFEHIAEAEE